MRGDDANGDAVRRVRAGPRVDHVEHGGGGEVRRDLVAQSFVVIVGELLVDLAPPDAIGRRRLVDEELVLRRAAGELAGVDDQRAAFCEAPVAARERMLVEQRGGRVSIDGAGGVDPLPGEIHAAGQFSRGHPGAPPSYVAVKNGCMVRTSPFCPASEPSAASDGPLRDQSLGQTKCEETVTNVAQPPGTAGDEPILAARTRLARTRSRRPEAMGRGARGALARSASRRRGGPGCARRRL